MKLTGSISEDISLMDGALNTARAFDIIKREFDSLDGRHCVLYAVDGLVKDTVLTESLNFFMRFSSGEIRDVPYIETERLGMACDAAAGVLRGGTALLIDGSDEALIMYARSYPLRSIEEPENDKVLRGPRDGFGESVILNTSLIRRRIRDPLLCTEKVTVGKETETDVALCYLDGKADRAFVAEIKRKLGNINTNSLNMGAESIAEMLIPRRWYNPFPKIRYTERPDTACAHITEGSVIIICDNYPAVMILPTGIFDFLQETDDFYFPPLVGTYLRLIRGSIIVLTLLMLPTWFLFQNRPERAPAWLEFMIIENNAGMPLLMQILAAEIAIDGLKLASLNTPSMLGNSLSVVAGLILSDFAVSAGWFEPAVILYVAITAIGNFTQVSYELGYALKFMRLFMLLAVAIFDIPGYIVSFVLMLVLIATNKGVGGRCYLYPLFPFNAAAFKRLIIRSKKRGRD